MNLRELLHALADDLADRVEARSDADEYYDQASSPLPARTHCRLVRSGAVPGFKVRGRVLVRRADLRAYIERHPVEPIVAAPARAATKAERVAAEDAAVAAALERLGINGATRRSRGA